VIGDFLFRTSGSERAVLEPRIAIIPARPFDGMCAKAF
jgi:hypothetical protein